MSRVLKPYLITFFLLAFAIIIGIIIMNFNTNVEVDESCNVDLGLSLAVINDEEDICFDSEQNEVKFTLQNGVQEPISRIDIIINQDEDKVIVLDDLNIALATNYVGRIKATIPVDSIKFTPYFKLDGKEVSCSYRSLVAKRIPPCKQ